ncbi:MAG: endonuclease MutS2 [Tenericutes bacterium HGW-Tenericutes-1]|nr:MAG: endonuclease MutS2 [Tenericutes bacterium HGW-Tenericutes-1]
MMFNQTVLEFPKILAQIKNYAETDIGKLNVMGIEATNNSDLIKVWLDEVFEAKTMIERYDTSPMGGVLNVAEQIKRASLGSTLSIEDLLNIVSLVEAVANNQRYIRKIRQLEISCMTLNHYYDELVTLTMVKTEIDKCIDVKGQIYDDASEELATIRKKLTVNQKRVTEKMDSLLKSESQKLTDSIITIRNNRLVLPVKAEFKNSFKGIIHDQSSSRETVFIEPMGCVEINNLIQTLYLQESDAIEKILARLSGIVGDHATELMSNFNLLTTLDVIFAKAKYAIANDGTKPEITDNTIHLIKGRHPLISKELVVSNTIHFGRYRSIIITGPNTGGKTVALKLLGLLSIMVQSGLLIPVDEGSKTMVFSNIFADIGDEQSIEQSLSTFSSHITKIIKILESVDSKSLVLLDELGSGTDPKEGASLAISIMDYLRESKAYTMVTTHYPEMKLYAFNLDDTVNASVEFDIDTLRPTYRLQIGTPGTSNALEIAKRLGLRNDIIEHAKKVSLSFDNQTSVLMKKLEIQSIELNQEIDDYKSKKNALELRNHEIQKVLDQTKKDQNKAYVELEKYKAEIIEKTKEEAMELIKELDIMRKQESFKEHELAKLKHDIKNLGTDPILMKKINQKKISIGDIVTVIPYQKQGIVMKLAGANKYEVQMGILTSVFSEDQLEYSDRKSNEQKVRVSVTRSSSPKVELDLRGMRFEEAMMALEKHIDDCLINNLEFTYVIHGYGTGALRKGVQELIRKNKQIKSSRVGGEGEGGSGVTVLYFK